jgi:pre-mRNA-splicing helicase BRR2
MDIHLQSFSTPHFPSLMIAMSKPAYLAIMEYSPTKPVIIFVPSRRQCRLTADDLLTHCGADDNADRFLNIELEDLQPHLDHITDQGLVETLKHGIGYYHEALNKQDRRIVERLFQSGAIQVLIASKVSKNSLQPMVFTEILSGFCLEPSRGQLHGYHHGRSAL